MNLPMLGRVHIPRPEQAASLEIIEWPIALAIRAGHAMAQQHHSRVAEEIGEALEQA